MDEIVWQFRTKNFFVVCTEYEPQFVDHLVHSQVVIDALENGGGVLTHIQARVYRRDVEVGNARLPDCIHMFANPSETEAGHDRVIVADHSYRQKVVRWAINDARETLAEIQSNLPDLYLRKRHKQV